MKIVYVGSHRGGVFLPGDIPVAHGEPVDVADDVAAELLERRRGGQPEWAPADPTPAGTSSPDPAPVRAPRPRKEK